MSDNHTGQEGAHDKGLIAQVVQGALHAGFYAYVIDDGHRVFVGGPYRSRNAAELEAHEWIVGMLRRRLRAEEERTRVLKLHAGEHPAITDEQIEAERAKAVRT